MRTYVLDAFALLALFRDETGADRVDSLLRRARAGQIEVLMSVINLGEVVYRTARDHSLKRSQEVSAFAQALAIEFIDADRSLALLAAGLKGVYRMSYADCFAAALAQRESATLVTGDPDFRQVEESIPIEWLPVEEPR
jgi:predicted nucleic acid-binding protein